MQYRGGQRFNVIAPTVHFICNRVTSSSLYGRGVGFAGVPNSRVQPAKDIFRTREDDIKRLFTIALALASLGLFSLGSEANANTVVKGTPPQVRIQIGQRHRRWHDRDRDNRGERVGYGRTTFETRLVQRGWHTYRETYQVRFLPDGRSETTLVSRVRVN